MTTAEPRLISSAIHTDDPCTATIVVEIPDQGTITQTWSWDTPEMAQDKLPQATRMTMEAANRKWENSRPGQKSIARRVRTPVGTIFLGVLSGPPLWRLPRVGTKTSPGYAEVMLGWWQRALVVGWRFNQRKYDARGDEPTRVRTFPSLPEDRRP